MLKNCLIVVWENILPTHVRIGSRTIRDEEESFMVGYELSFGEWKGFGETEWALVH